jgi:hypothetical protein
MPAPPSIESAPPGRSSRGASSQWKEIAMNVILHSRRLHRSSLFAAMLIGISPSALVCAAGPAPVPVPPSTPVNIVNAASIAHAEGIQHPFQQVASCQGAGSTGCESTLALPADRRLVLEYVSARCTVPGNSVLVSIDVSTTVDRASTPFSHILSHVDHPLSHSAIAAHPVKIYADAGSVVTLHAAIDVGQPTWGCDFSLSGQSVDVP